MKDKKKHNYVAIMAGGVGSRFWPCSTDKKPKQFLDILGTGKSLLRITFERFQQFVPIEKIYIVTHISYKEQIQQHIPEISLDQIICEPSRNNTAPGIAYAAFKIHKIDPKARLIMAPSDHIILKEKDFFKNIRLALNYCKEHAALVTLGILPSRPDTGYGYIKFINSKKSGPIKKVERFKEKPDLQTAIDYMESGDYLWNSGMFIWKTKDVLDAFEKNANGIYSVLSRGWDLYNTTKETDFINEHFPNTPNISVDYAIMENADNVYTIPSDIGWSDLGTWNALHAFLPKDENENVILNKKNIVENCSNNLVKTSRDKTIILKNLNDFIVIDGEDVLMIYPKNKEQEIREVRELANKI